MSFLQRAVGYTLTGQTREQCLFFLYGSGANGKSTFLNALKELLGDYATQCGAETLMVKYAGGGANNDIARLRGARLVASSEVEDGSRLAENMVKQITGQDGYYREVSIRRVLRFRAHVQALDRGEP